MYKSPIEIIYGRMQTQLEGEILRAVQKVDVVVDKDELIKALAYDRQQYEAGFADGEKSREWIPATERLPEDDVQVLACTKRGKAFSAHCENGRWRVSGSVQITHWMPLPDPPKEVTEA